MAATLRITCARCGKPRQLTGAAAAQWARSEAKARRVLEAIERQRRAQPLNVYSRALERRDGIVPPQKCGGGLQAYDRALAKRAGGAR